MNAPIPLSETPITADGASPVMAQFFDAKARQPDALIFFRMGDFYELFFEDAIKAAAAIGITQTHRGAHNGQPIPMAGVPVHAAEAYLAKLIRAGFKVAVCEQMEDPAEARKRGYSSEKEQEGERFLDFLGSLPELLADQKRRARTSPHLPVVCVGPGRDRVAERDDLHRLPALQPLKRPRQPRLRPARPLDRRGSKVSGLPA